MASRSSPSVALPRGLPAPLRALDRVPRRVVWALGYAGLVGLLVLGTAIVLNAAAKPAPRLVPASRDGYPDWMGGVFKGISGTPYNERFFYLFLAMCGCYLLVLACRRELAAGPALGVVGGLHALFLLAPPLLSRDIFNYFTYPRMHRLYGLNPYEYGAGSIPFDEAYRHSCCPHSANPYGPVFTLFGELLQPLGVATNLWVYKSAFALASLACVALVWYIAQRVGRDALAAALFVGLNPLLLVFAVGGAHNDTLMALFALAGVALFIRGREAAGVAASTAALGIKLSGVLLLPFMVAASGAKRRALAAMGLMVAAIMAVFVLRYGFGGLEGLTRAVGQQQSAFYQRNVPSQIGIGVGLGANPDGLKLALNVVFVFVWGWLVWRAWKGMDWITAAGWATIALLLVSTWLVPWYVVWLLPFAALGTSRNLRLVTLAFCGYLIWARVPLILV
jgi:glycosyl transferase family 87